MTENFVLTELIKLGLKPYFWRSSNTAEVDFLFEHKNNIIPVEVKAEEHTRAKSYGQFCKKYQPTIGLKLSLKNMGYNTVEQTRTISLPLYLLWNWQQYL